MMRPRTKSWLALCCLAQMGFSACLLFLKVPPWATWLIWVPLLGYAFALYHSSFLSKWSVVLRLIAITISALVLTFAAQLLLGILVWCCFLLFRGGAPVFRV